MKFRIVSFLACFIIGFQTINSQNNKHIEIGEIKSIQSNILSEEREYWISLPESYHDEYGSYKRYPIIVLLDGRVHFSAFSGMIKFMSRERNGSRQVPEMIVVGVVNVDRQRDFTPDKVITRRGNNTGGGKRFLGFLEKELIPEIDGEYRTIPYRIIFGHSLGGLLTVHSYMQDTTLFNSFISIDPSFGTWTNDVMDKKIELTKEQIFTRQIYMATANWNKRNIKNRDRHVRFYESLNAKCIGNYKGKLEYFEDENHGTVALPAFYEGLSYLFNGYKFSYRDATSRKDLVEYYKEISRDLSYEFLPPEELVNRIAYSKLRSENMSEKEMAIEFFEMNVENYPNSYNVYDSLGEAQLELGLKEKALISFEKSLELNADNINAINMINKIKGE